MAGAQGAPKRQQPSSSSDMMFMDPFGGDGMGNFDALDLDFDKPLEAHEEEPDFVL